MENPGFSQWVAILHYKCIMHDNRHFQERTHTTSSRTARVVNNEHDVDAVHLNKFHQEHAVADRIEAHHFHVLGCELAVLRLGDFDQRLEDAIVQVRKKP